MHAAALCSVLQADSGMVNLWAGKTPTLQCQLHNPFAVATKFYFSKFRQDIGPYGGPDDDGQLHHDGPPLKVAFFQKVRFIFLNLKISKKKYSKKLS